MKMNLRETIENSSCCQKATGGSGHESIFGVESEQENLYLGAK